MLTRLALSSKPKVLLLNQANRVLGVYEFSCGGVAGTICDPKLVFAAALKANASNIILAHNQPSERLTPSRADRSLTEKIKQAGEHLDINVLDHLIVSPIGYYSITEDAAYDLKYLTLPLVRMDAATPRADAIVAEGAALSPVLSIPSEQLPYGIAGHAITRSETSYNLLMHIWDENTLDLSCSYKIFCFNPDCRVNDLHHFLEGITLLTYQDAQLVMSLAAKDKASHIVLAQNKP